MLQLIGVRRRERQVLYRLARRSARARHSTTWCCPAALSGIRLPEHRRRPPPMAGAFKTI